MTEGLTLFNLLVEESQGVLHVRGLLLVEGSHTKLLVHQGLVLAAGWAVTVVCVVSEGGVVQVAKMGHHCVHSAQESFVLFDHVELVASTTKAGDGFSQVLRQNLEGSIGLLSADKDFADCTK